MRFIVISVAALVFFLLMNACEKEGMDKAAPTAKADPLRALDAALDAYSNENFPYGDFKKARAVKRDCAGVAVSILMLATRSRTELMVQAFGARAQMNSVRISDLSGSKVWILKINADGNRFNFGGGGKTVADSGVIVSHSIDPQDDLIQYLKGAKIIKVEIIDANKMPCGESSILERKEGGAAVFRFKQ